MIAKHHRYCLGTFTDGRLFLLPLSRMLKSMPSFIDTVEEGTFNPERSETTEKVCLGKLESVEHRRMRMRSYLYLKNKISNEKWKPLSTVHDSAHMTAFMSTFTSITLKPSFSDFMLTPKAYQALLLSGGSRYDKTVMCPSEPLMIVKTFLLHKKMFYYEELIRITSHLKDSVTVEFGIHSSLLVKGAFVVRSELLLQDMSLECYGTELDLVYVCACRDFVLWLFINHSVITEDEINAHCDLPESLLMDLLFQLAICERPRAWTFAMSHDVEFFQDHDDIVHKMASDWRNVVTNFSRILSIPQMIPEVTAIYSLLKDST